MELKPLTFEQWQEFLLQNSRGSLFHRWEWQDIVEKGFGVKVNRLGIFDTEGNLAGILPLAERHIWTLKLAGSPLMGIATPHSGPLGFIDLAEFLPALEQYAAEHRIDYLELALSDTSAREVLQQHSFVVQELCTLDLLIPEDEESLWSQLEVRCRNAVRKAEKVGVEILEARNLEEWLDPYYILSRGVYTRQGKEPPFSRDYFKILWEKLYPSGDLTVLMASYEGKYIAGGVFPRDRSTSYYLDGVSDREYNKVVPNNLIQWEYLKRALAGGVKLYDMVGANIPSIAKFKKSFGSTERSYLYAYRNRTIGARVGRTIYARYGSYLKKVLGR